ncbi:MAG: hypothetical protein AAF227_06945 [Pseudomonadota bacterium]
MIPLFDGTLEIELSGGAHTAQMQNGAPYFRKIRVAHDGINGNDFACAFVEVELLEDRKAG